MERSIIKTVDLKKIYLLGKVEVPALKGINMDIKKGDFVAIMGPSGSGKTTLTNIIGMINTITSGKVLIDGTDISEMSDNEKSDFRLKNIGFIFQFFNLFMELTVLENVMLPGMMVGLSNKECEERAKKLLEMVELGHRLNHKPSEISGGEQQRVTIARALMNNPAILLADEPTGNLDSETSLKVMNFLKKINKEQGQTIVMITHEEYLAKFAKKIIRMRDGLIQK